MKTKFKINTSLVLILIITVFAATFAQAQQHNQQDRHQGPPTIPDAKQIEKMVDELALELSLTETQKSKVMELHLVHFKEVEKMMEIADADRKKQREAMEAHKKDFENQMGALFSNTQKVKFEEFMKNRKPPMQEEKGPHQQKK